MLPLLLLLWLYVRLSYFNMEQYNNIMRILCFGFYYDCMVILWEISPLKKNKCVARITTFRWAKFDTKFLQRIRPYGVENWKNYL